jgi:hypothetical protein
VLGNRFPGHAGFGARIDGFAAAFYVTDLTCRPRVCHRTGIFWSHVALTPVSRAGLRGGNREMFRTMKSEMSFAIVNLSHAIPGYSHGTVISVHRNEMAALIADLELRASSEGGRRDRQAPMFVLPLAVHRKCGEHVRLSDLGMVEPREARAP